MVVRIFFMSNTTCFLEMIVWTLFSVKANGFNIQHFVWSYHISIVSWNWFFDFIIRFVDVFVVGVCFYQFAIVSQFVITRPCLILVSLFCGFSFPIDVCSYLNFEHSICFWRVEQFSSMSICFLLNSIWKYIINDRNYYAYYAYASKKMKKNVAQYIIFLKSDNIKCKLYTILW